MKKLFLSLALMAQCVGVMNADVHKLIFDGTDDMYGYTRQTSNQVANVTFVPEITFTEAGINFSITKATDTGKGFALVNAGGTNAGIFVYSGMTAATFITPKITLTVPKGKITSAKMYMSGSALVSLDLIMNETETEGVKDDKLYYWLWNNTEGVETVTIEWANTYYTRYIHSIELTYTQDLGGKKPCGLAFGEESAIAYMGEPFTAPKLENPNNLPLSWSSSKETVATVDAEGKITPVGGGKTTITVATVGNDEFGAGNASYELQVIPVATSLAQLATVAPEVNDQAKVNFPLTVTFGSTSFAFVLDAEGHAGCIQNVKDKNSTSGNVNTIYKAGDVIPAGWVATNATIYESVVWEGLPEAVTETVTISYPEVTSVTKADVDRVVILKDVTFTTPTAEGLAQAYGTTPDGKTYEFQNTYGVRSKPAGVYDVTCVVRYSKRGTTEYFFLAPINYESKTDGLLLIGTEDGAARYFDLRGNEVADPHQNIYIKVKDGKAEKVLVK